jgi:hypothetical protein
MFNQSQAVLFDAGIFSTQLQEHIDRKAYKASHREIVEANGV